MRERKKNAENKSEPWFDAECRLKKEHINHLGNKIKKSPLDQSLRTMLSEEKRSSNGLL